MIPFSVTSCDCLSYFLLIQRHDHRCCQLQIKHLQNQYFQINVSLQEYLSFTSRPLLQKEKVDSFFFFKSANHWSMLHFSLFYNSCVCCFLVDIQPTWIPVPQCNMSTQGCVTARLRLQGLIFVWTVSWGPPSCFDSTTIFIILSYWTCLPQRLSEEINIGQASAAEPESMELKFHKPQAEAASRSETLISQICHSDQCQTVV